MSTVLDEMKSLTVAELASLSAKELLLMQQAAELALQQAQATKDWINGAIVLKYRDRTQALRQTLGKDTGVIHFDDEGVKVTANLPKKPQWDQKQLAAVARRMWDSGQDPHEFIDIRYRISERQYTSWPKPLQADFAQARTVATGKASFQLSINDKEV